MEKVVLTIIFLLGVIFLASTIIDKDFIDLTPDWKIGETREYILTRETWENNILVNQYKVPMKLKVLDMKDGGYILECEVEKTPEEVEILSIEDLKATETIKYVYSLWPNGSFKELLNLQEVNNILLKLCEDVKFMGKDNEAVDAIRIGLLNLKDNEPVLNLVLAKELTILHFNYIYALQFKIGGFYSAQVEIANPWGEEPLTGIVDFAVRKDEKGWTTIEINERIDKEKSVMLLQDIKKALAKEGISINVPESVLLDYIDFTDTFIYKFKEGSKWVETVNYVRKIKFPGNETIHKFVFTAIH